MEACASAHYWGREIAALGHEVRLVPPVYVKPFVKRHKNDAADAEAITEAARRPTMHFVAVKSESQQAQAMLFHTRDLLVRQRTQTINALRGHLAEYGVVAPQGRARIGQLAGVLGDEECGLPEEVVELGRLLLGRIDELDGKIDGLDRKLRTSAREHEETERLMTIPGRADRSRTYPHLHRVGTALDQIPGTLRGPNIPGDRGQSRPRARMKWQRVGKPL